MEVESIDVLDKQVYNSFQVLEKLGQGGYGQVWKVRNKQTSIIYALKRIYDAFRNSIDAHRTYREIKYLQKLHHPNIVNIISFIFPQNSKDIYIMLELMQSDLSSAIRSGVLKQIHKHYLFYQIVNGVSYLHSANLIHRDLKPTNILINQKCEAKLCDFGLIRSVAPSDSNKEAVMTENIATRWYRAPQILFGCNNYGKPIDIWGLGCVLAEIFLGRPIFQGSSAVAQLQKIFEVTGKPSVDELYFVQKESSKKMLQSICVQHHKQISEMFENYDKNLVDLLEKIFILDPSKRITIDEIMEHPFVSLFRGMVEEKKASKSIKVLYEDRVLKPENVKALLMSQIDSKYWRKSRTDKSCLSTVNGSNVQQSLKTNSRMKMFQNIDFGEGKHRFSPQKEQKKVGSDDCFPKIAFLMKKEEKISQQKGFKAFYQTNKDNVFKIKGWTLVPEVKLKNRQSYQLQNASYYPDSPQKKSKSPLKSQDRLFEGYKSIEIKNNFIHNRQEQRKTKNNYSFEKMEVSESIHKNLSHIKSQKQFLRPTEFLGQIIKQQSQQIKEKGGKSKKMVPNFILNRGRQKSKSPEVQSHKKQDNSYVVKGELHNKQKLKQISFHRQSCNFLRLPFWKSGH